MKKLGFFVAAFFLLTVICGSAQAAEKLGYVSIEKVGDAYLKAKDYMKVLEDKEATYSGEIDKKRNEVKQFQDKMNMLSEKEKEAKSGELETKIKALQELAKQKQSDLRKEQLDKTIELSKDIKEAITKLAEKEGFTIIFDAAALAYQPKGMDVTDQVIDILNKGYKVKK